MIYTTNQKSCKKCGSRVGDQPSGIVVSDRYAVYGYVDVQQRQICWAHLLRDFRRMSQRDGEVGCIGKRLLGAGSVYETCRRQGRDLWNFMHESLL